MPSHQYSLIASQPQARTDLAASDLVSLTEKAAHPIHAPHAHTHEADENACNQCDAPPSEHRGCHNATLRRLFLPAIIALLLLGGLLAYGCASGHGAPAWMDGLVRRAVGDGTSSSGTGGPFVNRKLYLVVIFVGLLVVVILAVMLSAWCCKVILMSHIPGDDLAYVKAIPGIPTSGCK
ncbi:hypothetical protein B0H34DRAFT_678003 [Crassisporium funariophilum]|nr:hypothetical protein B0H34DRAFT_678003 [Crassisporium funariophilum]